MVGQLVCMLHKMRQAQRSLSFHAGLNGFPPIFGLARQNLYPINMAVLLVGFTLMEG